MPKMSAKTYRKLQEQVLGVLYERYPEPVSALVVADSMVRDHELIRRLLLELEAKKLAQPVKQGKTGELTTWKRWKLAPAVHAHYSQLSLKQ